MSGKMVNKLRNESINGSKYPVRVAVDIYYPIGVSGPRLPLKINMTVPLGSQDRLTLVAPMG